MRILVFLFMFLVVTGKAFAYIDPGTGGYLISQILAIAGGFIALVAATCIHFFRFTLRAWWSVLWGRFRILTVIVLAAIIGGAAYFAYDFFQRRETPDFDPKLSGAHVYDAEKIFPGYNLYEGKLIDNEGNLVKKWSSIYLGTIDKNGDYYAQKYFEAPVWGRYTWDDKVIWEKEMPIHHQILLTPHDTVITFTKEVKDYKGRLVEFDVIVEFKKDGTEIDRYSLYDHLEELREYHKPLELDMPQTFVIPEKNRKEKSIWGGNYDYYHLNYLSLVPPNKRQGTHDAFNPGNWIISFRHGSMIFILDKDTKKVLWRAIDDQVPGRLEGQHSPQMLPSGNILIFDNGRYREWSRVIAIDPVNLAVLWEYKDERFYTLSQGNVQFLDNQNLLVTEGETGRVFELTPQKEIVWEYYHPDQQDETNSNVKEKWGLRQEIYKMERYPKAFIDQFLKK